MTTKVEELLKPTVTNYVIEFAEETLNIHVLEAIMDDEFLQVKFSIPAEIDSVFQRILGDDEWNTKVKITLLTPSGQVAWTSEVAASLESRQIKFPNYSLANAARRVDREADALYSLKAQTQETRYQMRASAETRDLLVRIANNIVGYSYPTVSATFKVETND